MISDRKNPGAEIAGRGLAVLLVVVMLALVVGGIFFLGVFDDEGGQGGAAGLGDAGAESVARGEGTETTGRRGSAPRAIETREYDPRREADSARVDPARRLVTGRVEDPHGASVAEAQLQLVLDVGNLRDKATEGEVHVEGRSAPDGSFVIEGLRPRDTYVLRVSHPEFSSTRCYPVALSKPESLRQIVRLETGVSIAGTVRDAGGGALGGVEILVFDRTVAMAPGAEVPEAKVETDRVGKYRVPHVRPGSKKIIVRRIGWTTAGRDGLVVEENVRGIDFTLQRGEIISGRVIDALNGGPIEGVRVMTVPVADVIRMEDDDRPQGRDVLENRASVDKRLRQRSEAARRARGTGRTAVPRFITESAVSDAEGRFVVQGLGTGRYRVMASGRGFRAEQPLVVPGGTEGLVVSMRASAHITGRVVDDATGQPIKAFSLATSSTPEGRFISGRVRQHFENEEGRFTYADVTPGRHYLVAEVEGHAGGRSELLTIGVDQKIDGLEIRVVKGVTVRGRVLDDQGNGIRGAEVRLVAEARERENQNPFSGFIDQQLRLSGRNATTDSEGAWRLDAVMPGRYGFRATHEEYAPASVEAVDCEDGPEIAVPDLVLERGATVTGKVTLKNGKPDSKAIVSLSSEPPTLGGYRETAETDGQGRFRFTGLSSGLYRVQVVQRNGALNAEDLFRGRLAGEVRNLGSGETVDIEFPP